MQIAKLRAARTLWAELMRNEGAIQVSKERLHGAQTNPSSVLYRTIPFACPEMRNMASEIVNLNILSCDLPHNFLCTGNTINNILIP